MVRIEEFILHLEAFICFRLIFPSALTSEVRPEGLIDRSTRKYKTIFDWLHHHLRQSAIKIWLPEKEMFQG